MLVDNISLQYSFIDSLNEWNMALLSCKYIINPDLFQIEHSFFQKVKINNRKRKKPTDEFSELEEFHNKLQKILDNFRMEILKLESISNPSEIDPKVKNLKAIDLSNKFLDNNTLLEACYKLSETNNLAVTDSNLQYFHKFIENDSIKWKTIDVLSNEYLLPPNSGFIMSDIKFANKLIRNLDRKFDLIVIDPPVKNKSVKNSNAYGFLDELELLELPVRHVVKKDCLVAVWCTNSGKCMESVESCLFRAWGIKLKAVCSWLKVTKTGESVLDINDRFRRPYEKLYIGKVTSEDDKKSGQNDPICQLDDHVILSVPCSMHSAKPNLQNFLSKYLPENPQCLELFARNLYPGWISWGNEPLKFLRTDLMIPTKSIKSSITDKSI